MSWTACTWTQMEHASVKLEEVKIILYSEDINVPEASYFKPKDKKSVWNIKFITIVQINIPYPCCTESKSHPVLTRSPFAPVAISLLPSNVTLTECNRDSTVQRLLLTTRSQASYCRLDFSEARVPKVLPKVTFITAMIFYVVYLSPAIHIFSC